MPDNDKSHKENKMMWPKKKKNDGSGDTNLNWVVSKGLSEKVPWNWVMNYKNASPPPQTSSQRSKRVSGTENSKCKHPNTEAHLTYLWKEKKAGITKTYWRQYTCKQSPKALKNMVWNLDFIRLAVIEIQNVTMTKECKLYYK